LLVGPSSLMSIPLSTMSPFSTTLYQFLPKFLVKTLRCVQYHAIIAYNAFARTTFFSFIGKFILVVFYYGKFICLCCYL
jgi:hypothetical protein